MTTFAQARLVDAACRTDFATFFGKCFHTVNPGTVYHPGWHSHTLAYHLERVRRGRCKRLIINVPPRFGKSLETSVALPAFILGHDPTKRIVVISYNSELAVKLHNEFRAVVESVWFQRLFPAMRIARSTEFETSTEQRGYRRATSIDGTLTGIGGDILIIDDYLKPSDAVSDNKRTTANNLFFNTVLSRLDNKQTDVIIFVGQRLHIDDLTALLLRLGNEWTLLSLPAIAEQEQRIPISDTKCYVRPVGDVLHPDLLPIDYLQSLRASSPETYAAQFQQRPLPPGGPIIKPEWIRYYDALPKLTSSSVYVQSWDPALKPGASTARSACTTWLFHDKYDYLVDMLVGRFDYVTLKERAISLARSYKPAAILIEDTLLGTPLITELKQAGLPVIAVEAPRQDKVSRLLMHVAKFANSLVLFPNDKPCRAEMEGELFGFPGGPFDDIVDSMTQALAYVHSGFDLGKLAAGMENLASGLAFEQMFWRRF